MRGPVATVAGACLALCLCAGAAHGTVLAVQTLWAGQNIDAGTVTVETDGTNLLVTFETKDGWELMETHLYVGCQPPESSSPGRFPFQHEGLGGVTTDPYLIPLAQFECQHLCLAVHAVVQRVQDTQTIVLTSNPLDCLASSYDEEVSRFVPCSCGPAVPAWQHNLWKQLVNPVFADTGATWIWESYRVVRPRYGDIVEFALPFEIPDGYLPTSAQLRITADNAYEAHVNGGFVGTDGLAGDWRNSPLTQDYVLSILEVWDTVETYDVLPFLVAGGNLLEVTAVNEYMWPDDVLPTGGPQAPGTIDVNPGGAIFDLKIETEKLQDETAWGEGVPITGKNWSMYFCVDLP